MAVQQVAELLVHEGGSLVIIGVPEGTEIGIDYNSWNVGHQFKGIKMIPPGLHFIYYSAVNKDQSQTAPRTGFFYWFKQKEFLVKYWDPVNEEITDEGVDDVTIQRLKENIIELNNYLGSYPNSSLKKWLPLTNHITPEIINRIQPEKGHISAVTQVLSDDCAVVQKSIIEDPSISDQPLEDPESIEAPPVSTTGASCPNKQPNEAKYFAGVGEFTESEPLPPCKDADHHPSEVTFSPNMEYALRFNVIPRQKHPVGATPSEITLCNLDLSYTLEMFIDSFYHDNSFGILGELQFAFVCFLIGQVYDAFEQWKQLVKLLCFSEKSLVTRPALYIDFITVMHFQLKEVPQDFFVDIISRNNFLTETLYVFFNNVQECESINATLLRKSEQFQKHLTRNFKWDFTSEPDENAPTIVLDA